MNEDIDTDGVEPPTEDELFEDRDRLVEGAVERANQFHRMMDGAKEWARQAATDLRVEQALEDDDEVADELGQVAEIVESVTARIEQGDNNRARQP